MNQPSPLERIGRHIRISRVAAAERPESTPPFLILFINSICNLKCEHCFYWENLNKRDDLTFDEIARLLPELRVPVRVVYGARDRILPDVAETMARVKRDVPQAEVTALPDCGHFLQEEAPQRVGELLAEFFGGNT